MPEKNVVALAFRQMSKKADSPWYREAGECSVPGGLPGEFYVPDGHAIGLEDIAAALGIRPKQLSRLRKAKYPEYDPEIARIIKKRDRKWTASYQDLFCAIVRRARYKSEMRRRNRKKRLSV